MRRAWLLRAPRDTPVVWMPPSITDSCKDSYSQAAGGRASRELLHVPYGPQPSRRRIWASLKVYTNSHVINRATLETSEGWPGGEAPARTLRARRMPLASVRALIGRPARRRTLLALRGWPGAVPARRDSDSLCVLSDLGGKSGQNPPIPASPRQTSTRICPTRKARAFLKLRSVPAPRKQE
jgi:hypothetical protein